jgi:uncharacterized protein with gpF-like domain
MEFGQSFALRRAPLNRAANDAFRRPFAVARTLIAADAATPNRLRSATKVKVKPGRTLSAVRPNPGIAANYRRKIDRLIEEMNKSVKYHVTAAYRSKPPAVAVMMAEDEGPATELRGLMARLRRRWNRRFRDAAERLARYFARSAAERTEAELRRVLRTGGFSVRFRPTRAVQDAMQATVAENVSLIRSIPERYFTQIEGDVMSSASAGRDLSYLTDRLQSYDGVTRRRAEIIARDQNNNMTATISRVRYVELGITEAVWLHSGGGVEPRPTHLTMSGKRYKIAEGMWDPAENEYVHPGQLINCRCVSRPVIPGLE